jgi:hypothetical protein
MRPPLGWLAAPYPGHRPVRTSSTVGSRVVQDLTSIPGFAQRQGTG